MPQSQVETEDIQRLNQAIEATARAMQGGRGGEAHMEQIGDVVRNRIREALRERVTESVRDRLADAAREKLRELLRQRLGRELRSALIEAQSSGGGIDFDRVSNRLSERFGDALHEGITEAIRERVGEALKERLHSALSDALAEGPVAERIGWDEEERIAKKIRERIEPEIRERIVTVARERLREPVRERVRQAVRERLRDSVQEAISQAGAGDAEQIVSTVRDRIADGLVNFSGSAEIMLIRARGSELRFVSWVASGTRSRRSRAARVRSWKRSMGIAGAVRSPPTSFTDNSPTLR
jgi:aminopeptidase N